MPRKAPEESFRRVEGYRGAIDKSISILDFQVMIMAEGCPVRSGNHDAWRRLGDPLSRGWYLRIRSGADDSIVRHQVCAGLFHGSPERRRDPYSGWAITSNLGSYSWPSSTSFNGFSNLVAWWMNTRFTSPIGPLRCLAMISFAGPSDLRGRGCRPLRDR